MRTVPLFHNWLELRKKIRASLDLHCFLHQNLHALFLLCIFRIQYSNVKPLPCWVLFFATQYDSHSWIVVELFCPERCQSFRSVARLKVQCYGTPPFSVVQSCKRKKKKTKNKTKRISTHFSIDQVFIRIAAKASFFLLFVEHFPGRDWQQISRIFSKRNPTTQTETVHNVPKQKCLHFLIPLLT